MHPNEAAKALKKFTASPLVSIPSRLGRNAELTGQAQEEIGDPDLTDHQPSWFIR
jgi:hypothetical protein